MTPPFTVRCPICGAPLVERANKKTNSTFLGCETWPLCSWTQPVPHDLLMERAGAARLPGID